MNSNIILMIMVVATPLLAAYLGYYEKRKWTGVAKTVGFALGILVLGAAGVIIGSYLANAVDTQTISSQTIDIVGVLLTLVGLVVLAATLGHMGNKWMGAGIVTFLALFASILSAAGTFLGYYLGGNTGAMVGMGIGIILAGILVGWVFGKITKGGGHSARFAAGLWYGLALTIIFGYMMDDGWAGLLTVTLVTVLVFWGGLYYISGYILPLRDPIDKTDRRKAFRSLITFTMGTNYPYYFVDEKSLPELRVPGNQFLQFFAGPGFVYAPCDHAVYITDGAFVKGVMEPGLTFTGQFDREPVIFDLRTQLRAFPVEAVTKDGISIRVITFIPYRIDPNDKTLDYDKLEAGESQSFSFRKQVIHDLWAHQLVHHEDNKELSGEKHEWDGGPDEGLIPVVARPIMQDIISHYTVNELCAPYDARRDPRVEITTEMKKRVQEAVESMGLKLVGGGISNLVPQDNSIIEKRLETWRAKWISKMFTTLSKAQANRTEQLDKAQAETELSLVRAFENIINKGSGNIDVALALRFINTLGSIYSADEDDLWPLPNKTLKMTLKQLRGEIDREKNDVTIVNDNSEPDRDK